MRYELRVTAYDVLDQIHVGVHVWGVPDTTEGTPREDLSVTTTLAGEGESDIREWALSAIVAALEAL